MLNPCGPCQVFFGNPGSDSEAPEQRCRFTNGHRLVGSPADSFKVSMMNKKPSVATMEERRNSGLGVETEEWFALGSQRLKVTPGFAFGQRRHLTAAAVEEVSVLRHRKLAIKEQPKLLIEKQKRGKKRAVPLRRG